MFGCDFYVLLSAWLQVFVDGMEPTRKPLERMFEDSASEKSVRAQLSLLDKSTNIIQMSLYIKNHDIIYNFRCVI